MSQIVDAVVIGAGAGGGIVATRLARAGRRVTLLEAGGHHEAGTFSRFEARASRQLWNPPRFARTPDGPPVVMVSGKGVGGSTNINTKVGIRAIAQDYAKWFDASGLANAHGQPFGPADLDPWFEITERTLGIRVRDDWTHSVRHVEKGFNAMGATLLPVTSYTNTDCESCGSCTAGCPSNAGATVQNRYLNPVIRDGSLDLRSDSRVTRILTTSEGGRRRATGVEYRDADGQVQRIDADVVVVAAGALVTPQLLQLSGLAELGTPSSALIGRTLGTHTARMIQGIFPEPMDAHIVYPITAHCEDFADDAAGGFVVEATTLLDPIGLASNLVDEHMAPLWGSRLAEVMSKYRNMAGLFMMTNDSNVGIVTATEDLNGDYEIPMPAHDRERLDRGYAFCLDVLNAAGAVDHVSTGYITSHVQGSVRMGSDPERSACNADQQLWDVDGLYIGDGSVVPRTITYNPSLTIMAFAERLAAHLLSR